MAGDGDYYHFTDMFFTCITVAPDQGTGSWSFRQEVLVYGCTEYSVHPLQLLVIDYHESSGGTGGRLKWAMI